MIKNARIQSNITRNELAAKLDVTPRHLMSIENGRQKPSYNLLCRLIRELSIPADLIFYPEAAHDKELERAISMLRLCDKKELQVVTATLQSLLQDK